METNRKNWLLWGMLGLLAVLIAAGGYWWWAKDRETIVQIAPGQDLVNAKSGQLVSGFPEELILDAEAVIAKSYRVDHTEGNMQSPVATYTTRKPLADMISAYREYFSQHAWTVTREASLLETPATFFYAYLDEAEAVVTLQNVLDDQVQVTVGYSAQRQVGE